jgi:hypothetical protein
MKGQAIAPVHGEHVRWWGGLWGPKGPKTLILRSRPGNRQFLGSKRTSSSSKSTGADGGLRPPPAPVGVEEEDGRFDPQKSAISGQTS